jgi:hypothetical protein
LVNGGATINIKMVAVVITITDRQENFLASSLLLLKHLIRKITILSFSGRT